MMGVLSEVTVIRLDNSEAYPAHSWLRDDGTFEAFWYENGVRLCFFFQCDGQQIGLWKQYKLRLN